MIPNLYIQKIRKDDHERSHAVRVWRLADWLDPHKDDRDFERLRSAIEFPCDSRQDAELLVDRLNALQVVMMGEQFDARSL